MTVFCGVIWSHIWSDDWATYHQLSTLVFQHTTVNQSEIP